MSNSDSMENGTADEIQNDSIRDDILSSEESINIPRIQLILAEKRTSLAVLRTGIAVFSLPLSVITVLIATSRYYNFFESYYLIVPLLAICLGLLVLAICLVHRSVLRIWKQDAIIERIKNNDVSLAKFYRLKSEMRKR